MTSIMHILAAGRRLQLVLAYLPNFITKVSLDSAKEMFDLVIVEERRKGRWELEEVLQFNNALCD